MKHRHLLPDEIDQILDNGLGVAPLVAHIDECGECRGKLDDARAVTGLVEKIPHLAPSHRFSERVMAQVPVFVPWHVAASEAIAEWIPAAGRSRKVAIAAGLTIVAVLSLTTLALATQVSLLAFAANVIVDRTREIVVSGVGAVVVNLFGQQTFNAVAQHGAIGFAVAGGTILISGAAAFAGLRALATSASRRRG